MFGFLRGGKPQIYWNVYNLLKKLKAGVKSQKRVKHRLDSSLGELNRREKQLESIITTQDAKLLEMQDTLAEVKKAYDWALDEAKTTITKYDQQVQALRSEVAINEKTMEAMDASLNRLRHIWKAETAIQIRRELGAEEESQ